jgi:hypothetical protein
MQLGEKERTLGNRSGRPDCGGFGHYPGDHLV